MIFYHTVLQLWRVRNSHKPEYLNKMFSSSHNYPTRNLTIPKMKTSLGTKGVSFRGATAWNSLPPELKAFKGKIQGFKKAIKTWIKTNVEM